MKVLCICGYNNRHYIHDGPWHLLERVLRKARSSMPIVLGSIRRDNDSSRIPFRVPRVDRDWMWCDSCEILVARNHPSFRNRLFHPHPAFESLGENPEVRDQDGVRQRNRERQPSQRNWRNRVGDRLWDRLAIDGNAMEKQRLLLHKGADGKDRIRLLWRIQRPLFLLHGSSGFDWCCWRTEPWRWCRRLQTKQDQVVSGVLNQNEEKHFFFFFDNEVL